MLHDEPASYVKHWRDVDTDWSQERMLIELYNANSSGNPPYSYMRTPLWIQRSFDVINHCMAVDRERQGAREAAGGR